MEIKLKGPQAVVAIIVVLAFLGFRMVTQTQSLQSQGVEALERYLVLEEARGTLPEIEAALMDPDTTDQDIQALMNEFAEERFEVLDVTRSGLGDTTVAKVEIRDSRTGETHTRYFRMEYGATMGWRVKMETDAVGYWLNVI